jgi:dTDP-glucose pyrophosphorylase
MNDFSKICLLSSSTIETALSVLELGAVKIVLVVDSDKKLLGTLVDGDIRRGLLRKKTLSDTIEDIYTRGAITAKAGDSEDELRSLCITRKIGQIPIVNGYHQIIGLYILDDSIQQKKYTNHVVLMVGGLGKRLRPLTDKIPKPMLDVGGRPILQTIIEGFIKHGFTKFTMCIGYKSEIIRNFFEDGKKFGVDIEYIVEDKRMGTVGALTLLKKKFDEPFFVMNGDILTSANYSRMLDFHESHKSVATMGVREYDVKIPYGIVCIDNVRISSIEEKPTYRNFVNAGIYLLNPSCINLIPNDSYYDITTLFETLITLKETAVAFPLKEYWLDIGRLDDYNKANIDYSSVF